LKRGNMTREDELKAAEERRDKRLKEHEEKAQLRLAEERARLPGDENKELRESLEKRIESQRHFDRNETGQQYFRDRDAIDARYPEEAKVAKEAEAADEKVAMERMQARVMEDIKSREKRKAQERLEENQKRWDAQDKNQGRTK
jgi:hypothetical protein